jgi:hypothetical protein
VTLSPNNGTTAQTVASAALTGLAGNTTYFYRLRATNVDGTAVTASDTFKTTSLSKPVVDSSSFSGVQATSVTVLGNITSDGGAAITERGVAYKPAGSTSAFTKVTTTGTTGALSVSLTGLTPETPYTAYVYALNSVGEVRGLDLAFTTLKQVVVPGAPTITVTDQGSDWIRLDFTPGSDGGAIITNYQYSLDGGTNWTPFSPALSSSPAMISNVTPGSYSVKLRAVNSAGAGAASATQAVTVSSKAAITGAASAVGSYGSPFVYQITAAGTSGSFSATGLPPGLTVNSSTGLISGTPTQAGRYTATLRVQSVSPAPTSLSLYDNRVGQSFDFILTGAIGTAAVWGTDVYTADSNLVRSAVHAGVVAVGETKVVTVAFLPGPQRGDDEGLA